MLNRNKLTLMANAIRALSIDAIERANSGHPRNATWNGRCCHRVIFKIFKFDPSKCQIGLNRDRFVLSAGHGSMLLYALSYLTGYKDCNIQSN